jgi:hypothetical protein
MIRSSLSCIVFALISCTSNSIDNVYIIPNGFIGEVMIDHDNPIGAEEKIINNQRIYRIDSDGVCRINFPAPQGWALTYYIYENGDSLFQDLPWKAAGNKSEPYISRSYVDGLGDVYLIISIKDSIVVSQGALQRNESGFLINIPN